MSRYLVTYADELGDVMAAAEGSSEHNASGMAWRDLLKTVGSALAPKHRRELRSLPELADVRYVVGRGTGHSRVEVCSYGRLATARAAVRALDGQTRHHYTVEVDVAIPAAVTS